MSRSAFYQQMRELAREKRAQYGVQSDALNLTKVRGIYKTEGIRIDSWETNGRKLKAAYFCDEDGISVMVNKNLPKVPRLFALVHELKHHYTDQESIKDGVIKCGDYNANEMGEKGAEVFAAEFIYPEIEMRELCYLLGIGTGSCTPEKIVEFKRACSSNISYQFLLKRFAWFGFIKEDEHKKVQFQKLEEQLHGLPLYKQKWFKERRAAKTLSKQGR